MKTTNLSYSHLSREVCTSDAVLAVAKTDVAGLALVRISDERDALLAALINLLHHCDQAGVTNLWHDHTGCTSKSKACEFCEARELINRTPTPRQPTAGEQQAALVHGVRAISDATQQERLVIAKNRAAGLRSIAGDRALADWPEAREELTESAALLEVFFGLS